MTMYEGKKLCTVDCRFQECRSGLRNVELGMNRRSAFSRVLSVDEGYELRMRRLACCSMPIPNSTAESDAICQIMYKANSSEGESELILLKETSRAARQSHHLRLERDSFTSITGLGITERVNPPLAHRSAHLVAPLSLTTLPFITHSITYSR